MKLLQSIEIEGLRSIESESLSDIGALTTLVGRNSSGKSNVLRALNLFFNNEVEPGRGIDLSRDYHDRPKARRKKQVAITVEFKLPQNFKFRPGLEVLKETLGSSFQITKRWEFDRHATVSGAELVSEESGPVEGGEELTRQFLSLVQYRYIPNRSVPAALLRDESRAIASSIFAKMTGGKGVSDVLEELDTAAARLLQRASDSMNKSGAPLSEPGIATPASLADMLSVSGFQARGAHGEFVRDDLWGSGNQAFFLYQVLQAVDTNYSRSFGWRQAAIWGVEEPESGLHRDLETRLADDFRTWTRDQKAKLQIIQTTHSPIFTMASDRGYWIELASGSTTATSRPIPALVRDAERRGVAGWVQPMLAFPNNPVVLVEGSTDAAVLTHVAGLLGFDRFLFFDLKEFDVAEKGAGKDSVVTYLRKHGGLIPNRPKGAPLLVLLDWDVSLQELEQARKAYGSDATSHVLRMDESDCASEMGPDFRGIERFYPPSMIKAAAEAEEFSAAVISGRPYSISPAQLAIAKGKLKSRVLATTSASEVPALAKALQRLHAAMP